MTSPSSSICAHSTLFLTYLPSIWKGRLDKRWELWFDGFATTAQFAPDSTPVMTVVGSIVDRAALYMAH
jgi:hypothetical protein